MKKFIGRAFLVALAATLLVRAALAGSPVTARLDFEDGTCSGTIVAPSVILSAGHCFEEEEDNDWQLPMPGPTTMKVDGYKVKILAVVTDDNDHALVKVDFVFHNAAKLGKVPAVGAKVHYWGNPAGLNNVYREGYVTGYPHGDMSLDLNGFFGDSGAGIFDESGNVVGVVSYIHVLPHNGMIFRLMGAKALEFTSLQYEMMGVAAP
jgi:S1-C subfamily serine protease